MKSVVFPAPFGPIRPVIVPSLTARVQSFTARRPPKLFRTSLTTSIKVPSDEEERPMISII